MTSNASICSVTRSTYTGSDKGTHFPAIITEIKVGANSSITDCLVAKPIRYLGINGFVRFSAV
jgi:hypothetical protein